MLCAGNVLESGQKSIELEQNENGEIYSYMFTSEEKTKASGRNMIEVNLEGYLKHLMMIDDLDISGIVINENVQNVKLGRENIELVLELIEKSYEEQSEEAISSHPDFSKYIMDDGMLAVKLFNSIWCFCDPSEFENPYDYDGEPSLGVALEMRQMILDICETGKVLGFVVNDLTDNDEE